MKGTTLRQRARVAIALAAPILAATLLAACGGGGGSEPAPVKATAVKFDPANFGDPATRREPLPAADPGNAVGARGLHPGRWSQGAAPGDDDRDQTPTANVAGVRTVMMLDHEVDGGQVTQVSVDYVAEDKDGNVWNLGGYTEEYEGGRLVGAVDPWLQGVNGAKAGILVQADPETETPFYSVSKPDARGGQRRRGARRRGPALRSVRLLQGRPRRPRGQGLRSGQRAQVLRPRRWADRQRAARTTASTRTSRRWST